MTGLVNRARERVTNFVKRWEVEAPARRFMAFCRRKWPHESSGSRDSVVLVGLFGSYPSIFCYAYVTNYLAEKHGSRIESYQFVNRVSPLLRKLYESFGARFGLGMSHAAPFEAQVQAQVAEMLPALQTKWDVMNLMVDGVLIGDQVYDSYLRFYNEPTLRLEDPRFRDVLVQALRIFHTTRDYLARNRVTAFITDDFSYINSGIITRLMFLARVPIYEVLFGEPFSLARIDPEPSGAGHQFPPPVFYPYYRYPQLFQTLSEEGQSAGIERARRVLEDRLSGKFCKLVDMPSTTYAVSNERVLGEGPEPRILVMMHDFVDSPHGYRHMLFPDFVEWMNFLLERAVRTPFKWYVKPHPCTADASGGPARDAMNRANDKVVAELKERFPTVTFLDAMASNQQILKDGVTAMFTVHGTAGHEFAYSGVPVVFCGDNPHIAYDFNIHTRTLEEYEDCILRADQLQVRMDKRAIEECVFMNYLYQSQVNGAPVNLIDERIFAAPDWPQRTSRLTAFDEFIAALTPERERAVTDFFNRFFSQHG
ncbi:MAG: hypothetical protein P4L99_00170 [Chthoniobacter sp.]|nr:hypothetical protein [Chthoniobacter sp.]